jgi:hypothetical protein
MADARAHDLRGASSSSFIGQRAAQAANFAKGQLLDMGICIVGAVTTVNFAR